MLVSLDLVPLHVIVLLAKKLKYSVPPHRCFHQLLKSFSYVTKTLI